jgi:hypothetical protein
MADVPEMRGICDASGFDFPLSQLVKQWDGAFVHRRFVDKRNPQDFVTGIRENIAPRLTRPEAPDTFISGTVLPGDL